MNDDYIHSCETRTIIIDNHIVRLNVWVCILSVNNNYAVYML